MKEAALAVPAAASLALLVAPLPTDVALSRAALALLPWIACAGIPIVARAVRDVDASPWRRALAWMAFALAPACVGARIDVLLGAPLVTTVESVALALACVGALAWAAGRANGAALHAVSVLALVVGWPALIGVSSALASSGSLADPASFPLRGAWASVSPLGWIWRRAAARDPLAALDVAEVLAVIAGVAFVIVLAARAEAPRGEDDDDDATRERSADRSADLRSDGAPS